MPDLGQYAMPVLAAYGAGIALLVGLTLLSLLRARKVKQHLAAMETRRANDA